MPGEIFFIETPDILACKNLIPDQKDDRGNQDRGHQVLPLFIEWRLRIKTGEDGYEDRKDINREVQVLRFQRRLLRFLSALLQSKSFRFIFFWCVQKAECFTSFFCVLSCDGHSAHGSSVASNGFVLLAANESVDGRSHHER